MSHYQITHKWHFTMYFSLEALWQLPVNHELVMTHHQGFSTRWAYIFFFFHSFLALLFFFCSEMMVLTISVLFVRSTLLLQGIWAISHRCKIPWDLLVNHCIKAVPMACQKYWLPDHWYQEMHGLSRNCMLSMHTIRGHIFAPNREYIEPAILLELYICHTDLYSLL